LNFGFDGTIEDVLVDRPDPSKSDAVFSISPFNPDLELPYLDLLLK
jgi:hypothetical protein